MPSLEWIGKDKVIAHHQDVPVHELVHQYGFTIDGKQEEPTNSNNMIIHGDNLIALKSLLPTYEGKINCVYIDPPYNTGEEKWVYNDNVKDPRILAWLGQLVGKEGDDFCRHDKWLCMMAPRLQLIKRLLSFDGIIAISIGFHELHNLIQLCKEVFPSRQVVVVTVQTSGGKPKDGFNYSQEYVVFVAPKGFSPNPSKAAMNEYSSAYHAMTLAGFNQENRPNQVYPIFIDKETGVIKGVGKSLEELIQLGEYTGDKKDFQFDYDAPKGQAAVWCVTDKGHPCAWRLTPDTFWKNWEKGYIKVYPKTSKHNKNLFSVQYLAEGIISKIESGEVNTVKVSSNSEIPTIDVVDFTTGGINIGTIWTDKYYYTVHGSNELTAIFQKKNVFPYPKPKALVQDILQRISHKDSLILDCFGGSGTTAHAVLNLNKEDGGNRNFIVIEMMDYAESITAERIKRAIQGYDWTGKIEETIYHKKLTANNLANFNQFFQEANEIRQDKICAYSKVTKPTIKDSALVVLGIKQIEERTQGLGGSFDFYELGEPIFIDDMLNPNVSEESLREYIYFSETKLSLTRKRTCEDPYFLDNHKGTSYFFYYEPEHETVLNDKVLSHLITKQSLGEQFIIYADACLLSDDTLKRLNIVFKKIPREIRKF
ncbi:MAG: site-specific DNA-methyltransferase [Muribaculaceae bacterium]|nr:site-specific DNA-methyltransferase [Muribaculaceae bacterium]